MDQQLTHQANAPRLVRRPRRARMAVLQRMRLELRNQQLEQEISAVKQELQRTQRVELRNQQLEQENSALKQELQRTQSSLISAKGKRIVEREFHQGNEVQLRKFIDFVERALEVLEARTRNPRMSIDKLRDEMGTFMMVHLKERTILDINYESEFWDSDSESMDGR